MRKISTKQGKAIKITASAYDRLQAFCGNTIWIKLAASTAINDYLDRAEKSKKFTIKMRR